MIGCRHGKVIMQASMSSDGYIADPSGRVDPLFDRYAHVQVGAILDRSLFRDGKNLEPAGVTRRTPRVI
jgi:hypothetical protein